MTAPALSRRRMLAGLGAAALTGAARPARALTILTSGLDRCPRAWIGFTGRHPEFWSPAPAVVPMSGALWARCVGAMLAVPASLYDPLADTSVWRLPNPYGHCADLALGRMNYLLRRGLPLGALRPVTAITRDGRGHAVLAVMTNEDPIVLDNLQQRPVRWSASDLHWRARLVSRLEWEPLS